MIERVTNDGATQNVCSKSSCTTRRAALHDSVQVVAGFLVHKLTVPNSAATGPSTTKLIFKFDEPVKAIGKVQASKQAVHGLFSRLNRR